MDTQITKAKLEDLDDILNLNHKLFLYEASFTNTYDINLPFSEKGKNYFSDRIEDLEKGLVLVAKNKDKVIGYICGYLDSYSFRTLNPIAEIENMFVEEEFRGKNVGKLLFKEFSNVFKLRGSKIIKVSALSENKNAVTFYKKCGFLQKEITLELEIS